MLFVGQEVGCILAQWAVRVPLWAERIVVALIVGSPEEPHSALVQVVTLRRYQHLASFGWYLAQF